MNMTFLAQIFQKRNWILSWQSTTDLVLITTNFDDGKPVTLLRYLKKYFNYRRGLLCNRLPANTDDWVLFPTSSVGYIECHFKEV